MAAKRAMMGGNMKGRMAGNGSSQPSRKAGLSGSGLGRTRTTSRGKSPYRSRLAKAGEG